MVTAKTSLKIHDDQMSCGTLDGILEQIKDIREKLRKSEQSMGFS